MRRVGSVVCVLLGALLAVAALVVALTKATSPDVRGVVVVAILGLGAYACIRVARVVARRPDAPATPRS